MDIHEYQAKEILARFGVATPKGALAYSPEQAAYRAREIGGKLWVVKAQGHTGGRGKAGGVKLCRSEDEVMEAADDLLGKKLVTHQSGPAGKIVGRLYVEGGVAIAKELYLGFVLDRKSERVMVVASSQGGMEIEEIAAEKPESIVKVSVEPAVGMQAFQAREIAFALGLKPSPVQSAVNALMGCYRAFEELDATMLEINPLNVTEDDLTLDEAFKIEKVAGCNWGEIEPVRSAAHCRAILAVCMAERLTLSMEEVETRLKAIKVVELLKSIKRETVVPAPLDSAA